MRGPAAFWATTTTTDRQKWAFWFLVHPRSAFADSRQHTNQNIKKTGVPRGVPTVGTHGAPRVNQVGAAVSYGAL